MDKYQEAVDYILEKAPFGVKLGLENITELCNNLGNPQDKIKTIHVAGTNGKGSTTSILASILEENGYKVGVFTSPHLVDFRERIRIGNKKISKEQFIKLLEELKPFIKTQTFFEVTTALAFKYFAKEKVDIAIIEVGMGGRLDATNIIKPIATAITNIDFDHTKHLGNTYEAIASEKAGIIKQGIPLIVPENCNGLDVIRQKTKEKNAPIYLSQESEKEISLKGDFQKINLGVALNIIEVIKNHFPTNKEKNEKALKKIYWPGRMDFLEENILVDSAHNLNGAKELVKEIDKIKKNYSKIYFLTGIMKDKNYTEMLNEFEKIPDELILVKSINKRSQEPEVLAKNIKKPFKIIEKIPDALEYIQTVLENNELLVIGGSIYVLAEVFESLDIEFFE